MVSVLCFFRPTGRVDVRNAVSAYIRDVFFQDISSFFFRLARADAAVTGAMSGRAESPLVMPHSRHFIPVSSV